MLFLELAVVLMLARGLGALVGRLGQPPVLGEIAAGVLLGPTFFGGAVARHLFPPDMRPLLTALANVGVALFMFTVGLELDHGALRDRSRVTAGAVLGSTVVPFTLGVGLACSLLLHHHSGQPATFAVFVGLAVSVTAFPVLARILADRELSRTVIGGLALAVAAVVDVVAWTALAAVQAVSGDAGGYWRAALLIPFAAVLVALRPVSRRLLSASGKGGKGGALSGWGLAVVLIGALLSAAATEAMGMHYIFGAFLFGATLPRDGAGAPRDEIVLRTGQITPLLLPVYFVVAGLDVDLRGVGAEELAELGAIVAVAVAGKAGGTYLGARTQGLPGRDAAVLAALMNTRGLTELIILGVGLQLGLLDGPLYSLMVVMALVTTAMTGPLLSLIGTGRGAAGPPSGGGRGRSAEPARAGIRR